MLPLLVCWVLRWPFIIQGLPRVLRSPVLLSMLALLAWSLCALAWSPDHELALLELRYWRWAWLPLALWPVLHKRGWLIAAIAVGFLAAHAAQLADWLVVRSGSTLFSHPPTGDPLARVSGWWHHPVHGGIMLACAFGLHLGPAVFAVGSTKWLARAGGALALLGVVATGTRGSLLTCGVLLLAVIALRVVLWLRAPRAIGGQRETMKRHPARLRTAALATLLCIAVIAGLLFVGPRMQTRLQQGVHELQQAWSGGSASKAIDSDMGARIVAARSALDAFCKHPVRGLGLHAFGQHTQAFVQQNNIPLPPERVAVLRTAHNTPLHILASLGGVGFALWCALVISMLATGYRIARAAAKDSSLRGGLGSYAAAPMLAALAMLLAGQFDTLALNSPTACLATLLIALNMRPPAQEIQHRGSERVSKMR